tara:strand:- start:145 stop:696 length:552 start_codon:yes stop_codon:yes gene_type:complete
LPFATLLENELQLARAGVSDPGRKKRAPIKDKAAAKLLDSGWGDISINTHVVFFFYPAVGPDQSSSNRPVLGQHQQSGRINIKPPSDMEALCLRHWLLPMDAGIRTVVSGNQRDGLRVAFFGLIRDNSRWLMQEHRCQRRALLLRVGAQLNLCQGVYPGPELINHSSVYQNLSRRDESVCFSP